MVLACQPRVAFHWAPRSSHTIQMHAVRVNKKSKAFAFEALGSRYRGGKSELLSIFSLPLYYCQSMDKTDLSIGRLDQGKCSDWMMKMHLITRETIKEVDNNLDDDASFRFYVTSENVFGSSSSGTYSRGFVFLLSDIDSCFPQKMGVSALQWVRKYG